ncbi:MAG: hypothetical protein ACI841_003088 [Planctomycetota bacterium]|jgi:hypothetical protein
MGRRLVGGVTCGFVICIEPVFFRDIGDWLRPHLELSRPS